MAHAQDDMRTRGAILAAAALVGAHIELSDGDEWRVADGVVYVGLGWFAPDDDPDVVIAETLLLLWESVREARTAPHRRARRTALGAQRPELEPVLAAIDRMLAASDLLAAMPGLRIPLRTSVLRMVPELPGELPRHLQWVCLMLVTAVDVTAGFRLASSLTPEVQREHTQLFVDHVFEASSHTSLTRRPPSLSLLRIALTTDAAWNDIEQFERVFGLVGPVYERLLAQDATERGLSARGTGDSDGDAPTGLADAAGSSSGGDSSEATPGGDADDAASDEPGEAARAGDRHEGAEGSDLFEAEQAGFVQTVLSTPLPATGAWIDGLDLPDTATSESTDPDRTVTDSAGPGAGGPALGEYRSRRRQHAAIIDELRAVWDRVISERVTSRVSVSRVAEPDGDMLDRGGLVRIVTEVHAGVQRPAAFLSRRRIPKRASRSGSTDYVLLIDRSASMQGAQAEAAADAALIILESLAAVERDIAAEERALGIDLELSLRTALIVFDSTPIVVKPLAAAVDDDTRARVYAAVRSPRGSTDDASALRAAHAEFRRAQPLVNGVERRRVAILVSDGGSDDSEAAAHELRALRAFGVTVFGIGLRTGDLRVRYAPDGAQLDDPALLAHELARLVTRAGLDELRSRRTR